MENIKAVSLFSGGLDSILATRVIMEQGVDVTAVQFVTPFFNYSVLKDIRGYQQRVFEKFGIKVRVEDISRGYMDLLKQPTYGFGKNFNPCVDCKILMLRRAKEIMAEIGASFLVTGEVLGQRPMSQRRDTLNVIERDSNSKTILLRPLSAKLMKETEAELKGWVDREKLYNFSGRGRSNQIKLAKEYNITDYPAPAGGCILADPILSKRIQRLYEGKFTFGIDEVGVNDVELMLVGRQLLMPFTESEEDDTRGVWTIVGRDEGEDDRMEELVGEDDVVLHMEERPGPVVLLRKVLSSIDREQLDQVIKTAASLVIRYGRKVDGGLPPAEVICRYAGETRLINALAPEDETFRDWIF